METERLRRIRVVLAMGRDAFDAWMRLLRAGGIIKKAGDFPFAHGKTYRFDRDDRILIASYHFSRYNINTGRLTKRMVERLFKSVNRLLAEPGK